MAIVGYARVSTTDQDLTIQREALAAAGAEKVFEEKRSGTTTQGRDELSAALDWVREGDILIVTRLDRLARSVVDLHRILARLAEKKVGFRCLSQPVDTTTPHGRLMLSVLGAVAEFETDLRKERQLEGIARAKKAKLYTGRKPKADAAEIERLFRVENLGPSQIAKRLGISRSTVYRAAPGLWGEAPEHLRR